MSRYVFPIPPPTAPWPLEIDHKGQLNQHTYRETRKALHFLRTRPRLPRVINRKNVLLWVESSLGHAHWHQFIIIDVVNLSICREGRFTFCITYRSSKGGNRESIEKKIFDCYMTVRKKAVLHANSLRVNYGVHFEYRRTLTRFWPLGTYLLSYTPF